ncbi:MAG: NTP transferase domain-containing protein [Planctomycetes bacterium]|nr:NTP transferase domain-containing protein [Planctomycetota bacterium]
MTQPAVRAILLAAGRGRRMGPLGQRPKCLLAPAGQRLLDRHLAALAACGVPEAALVTGFGAPEVEAAAREAALRLGPRAPRLRFLWNERHAEGSVLSLAAAAALLDGPVLIMDADVLYPVELLSRLARSPRGSAFLLDEAARDDGEAMMLSVLGDRVVAIRRGALAGAQRCGEGVGFLKLDGPGAYRLAFHLGALVAEGRTGVEYEEAVDRLLAEVEVGYEPVAGLPWTELDFPEDLVRAEREVWPAIRRLEVRP